ncbi:MAG: N-acyl-D-amino-acid deacylase family protein, partial [Longimicrobiales bacterium]
MRFRGSVHVLGFTASCLACVVTLGCRSDVPVYDLVLRGGTVVDGSGTPGRFVDVGMVGDLIETVAPNIVVRSGTRVIDVPGLIVAPGFWDNHAHLVELEDRPVPENFLRQGITTIVASLHSQDQVEDMSAYRARVQMAPNVGLFAGHTWIRKRVMGLEDRPPTQDELAWMVALVDSAMRQGALGLATGLEYVPAVYADLDEVVALAEAASSFGGVYATHMRDEGVSVLESVRETLEVGRLAEIPVQINHHKVTGAAHFGWTEQTLALLDSATAAGTDVTHDVYPYTAYSTYSDLMFPPWALADGPEAFAARVAEPATRARLVQEMRVRFPQQTGASPASIQFREIEGRPDLQGRTLADYLEGQGQPT